MQFGKVDAKYSIALQRAEEEHMVSVTDYDWGTNAGLGVGGGGMRDGAGVVVSNESVWGHEYDSAALRFRAS